MMGVTEGGESHATREEELRRQNIAHGLDRRVTKLSVMW